MTTFYDQFMQHSSAERERIALEAGFSIGYVTKHMYSSARAPVFHFHNAVAMDQASGGTLPFYQHTSGSVDWDFVRRTLNTAHRRGVL